MNEFRGTVSLNKPFLGQPEVAEFLQPSPEDAFPRSVLYRLLSVAECFLQSQLTEQNSEAELVGIRLNCKLLEPGEAIGNQSETIGSCWIEWNSESLGEHVAASSVCPKFTVINESLDPLASRIHEVLVSQASPHQKEKSVIASSLVVNLVMSIPVASPSPRLMLFPFGDVVQPCLFSINSSANLHQPCRIDKNNNRYYLVDREQDFVHPRKECETCN